MKIDIKATKPESVWAMIDSKEFDRRHYDAYIWVKVNLPLNHLARAILQMVKNGNLHAIEDKIHS
ncbi:MAG: hypothetical protein QXI12_02115 [Candidatus Methanomethyliaceae archaeon]